VLAHHSLFLVDSDYAEERASELEVLESIFPDELQGTLSIRLSRESERYGILGNEDEQGTREGQDSSERWRGISTMDWRDVRCSSGKGAQETASQALENRKSIAESPFPPFSLDLATQSEACYSTHNDTQRFWNPRKQAADE